MFGYNLTTLLILAAFFVFPVASGSVARRKNRSFLGGFILGLFLGPVGLAIVLLLSPLPGLPEQEYY